MNLSACLADLGVRVLLIDLDPQGNCTSGLGIAREDGGSLYPALVSNMEARKLIRSTRINNLSIIRSHQELAGCEIELAQQGNHLVRLREVLNPLRNSRPFDYIIMDFPPSPGVLMTGRLLYPSDAADQQRE